MTEAPIDPQVRAALYDRGITIPADMVVVAARHDTTTDEISADPLAEQTPMLEAVMADPTVANDRVRRERLAKLPAATAADTPQERHGAVTARAPDWAQPIPEWGLAGNAAFIIGSRWLSQGLNLQGRVFLHSYDADLDEDNSVLELLIGAPTVVTQWINSQDYFSSVDNQHFGAGDKTTHNVVGDVAVLSGAHRDLRIGLPWQCLATESRCGADLNLHRDPLRVQVVVHASPPAISSVLSAHPDVAALFSNGWAAMSCIDPDDERLSSPGADLRWQPSTVGTPGLTIVDEAQTVGHSTA